jgi:hypothetical protein
VMVVAEAVHVCKCVYLANYWFPSSLHCDYFYGITIGDGGCGVSGSINL